MPYLSPRELAAVIQIITYYNEYVACTPKNVSATSDELDLRTQHGCGLKSFNHWI